MITNAEVIAAVREMSGPGISEDEIARKIGCTVARVSMAADVLTYAPDLAGAVSAGTMRLKRAYLIMRERRDQPAARPPGRPEPWPAYRTAAEAAATTPGAAQPLVPALTQREFDVLAVLCRPHVLQLVFRVSLAAEQEKAFTAPATCRQIATSLAVADATVTKLLGRLYQKFQIPEGPDRRIRLANHVVALGTSCPGALPHCVPPCPRQDSRPRGGRWPAETEPGSPAPW